LVPDASEPFDRCGESLVPGHFVELGPAAYEGTPESVLMMDLFE